jgi:hypothetical protein
MFLHPENQELLWNTLQKSPYLVEFTQKFTGHREEWFRGITEQFYTEWISRNGRVPENAKELLEINKIAIQVMVADLKRLLGFSELPSSQPIQQNMTPYNIAEERKRREDSVSEIYNRYQSEYNKLLKQPALPIKELPRASADDKIKNMEELVKEHTRIRDLDLAIYSASSPNHEQNPNLIHPVQSALGRIKIMDEINGLDDELVQIKKQVHWESSVDNKTEYNNSTTFANM